MTVASARTVNNSADALHPIGSFAASTEISDQHAEDFGDLEVGI
jgi:hypothetical protein